MAPAFRVFRRRLLLAFGGALLGLGAACGGEEGDPGVTAGGACDSRGECGESAWLCFAAGTASTCSGGALCVGTAEGRTCAFECEADADCATRGAASVCLLGCQARIMNGHCVEPAVRDDLSSYPFCSEEGNHSAGISGSST